MLEVGDIFDIICLSLSTISEQHQTARRRSRSDDSDNVGRPVVPAKERIINAAMKLYACYGVQVPLRAIADEAGTNLNTIEKYYGDGDGLVMAFLRECEEENDLVWKDLEDELPDDPAAQVREWVNSSGSIRDERDWSHLHLLRAAAFLRPYRHSPFLSFIRQAKLKQRKKLTERCRAAGFVDPNGLADKLLLLSEGAMAGDLTHGVDGPSVELLKAAELMISAHKPQQAST